MRPGTTITLSLKSSTYRESPEIVLAFDSLPLKFAADIFPAVKFAAVLSVCIVTGPIGGSRQSEANASFVAPADELRIGDFVGKRAVVFEARLRRAVRPKHAAQGPRDAGAVEMLLGPIAQLCCNTPSVSRRYDAIVGEVAGYPRREQSGGQSSAQARFLRWGKPARGLFGSPSTPRVFPPVRTPTCSPRGEQSHALLSDCAQSTRARCRHRARALFPSSQASILRIERVPSIFSTSGIGSGATGKTLRYAE